MTPEERKGALVGLLGRLRTNAGSRLTPRTGDEEDFVPRSVVAARAEAAATAASVASAAATAKATALADSQRDALDDAMADLARPQSPGKEALFASKPPAAAVLGPTPLPEALREAEEVEMERAHAALPAAGSFDEMEPSPPTPRSEVGGEAPTIELGDSSDLDLDLFDPFDETTVTGAPDEPELLALESGSPLSPRGPAEPPAQEPAAPTASAPWADAPAPPTPRTALSPAGSQVPPAPPASLTRAIPMSASPTVKSRELTEPAEGTSPAARVAAPPSAPSAPASSPRLDPPRTVPRPMQPAPISRVEAVSAKPTSPGLPFDEATEDQGEMRARAPEPSVRISAEDELERKVNMPPRKADPLAQTAQNPIPAAFERAGLRAEGTLVPAVGAETREAPAQGSSSGASRAPTGEVAAEEPVSSKQPLALDRVGGELDDSLPVDDGDEAPQSGEIASQRQPASGQHERDLDLDGATPSADQSDAVAEEAMALLDAESLPSAAPPTRPAVMGRRPLAVTSFLDVLDDALSLGES